MRRRGVNIAGFNSLTAVSLTSGFVAGVNTLDFVVTDQGPPMALRVDDLRGSANLQQGGVPEPSTIIFSGGALAALGLLRRKLVR